MELQPLCTNECWEESLVLSHVSNLKGAFLLFLSKSCGHGKVMMNPECGFLYARDRKMLSLNPQNTARGVILWSDSVSSTFTVVSLAVQDHEGVEALASISRCLPHQGQEHVALTELLQ